MVTHATGSNSGAQAAEMARDASDRALTQTKAHLSSEVNSLQGAINRMEQSTEESAHKLSKTLEEVSRHKFRKTRKLCSRTWCMCGFYESCVQQALFC